MKSVTTAIQSAIDAKLAMPRLIVTLWMPGTPLRFTNHTSAINFQGNTYNPRRFSVPDFTVNLGMAVDNGSISIDDADNALNAVLGSQSFSGREIEINRIYLSTSTMLPIDGWPSTDDKLPWIKGRMNRPVVNEAAATLDITIVNMFDRQASYGPTRVFGPICNNNFCDDRCGKNSGVKISGQASSGSATSLISSALRSVASMIGAIVEIDAGTNCGLMRKVKTHNTSTGQITWTLPCPASCDNTTKFHMDCEKTKSACAGLSQLPSFDGFDEAVRYLNYPAAGPGSSIFPQLSNIVGTDQDFSLGSPYYKGNGKAIPIVYGYGKVDAVLLDAQYDDATGRILAVYGGCAGPIADLDAVLVDGVQIGHGTAASVTLVSRVTGEAAQNFYLGTDLKYYPRTVCAVLQFLHDTSTGGTWNAPAVSFIVKGSLVQQYTAHGVPDGAPIWMDNPIWHMVDYLLQHASERMNTAELNWSQIVSAAIAASDANLKCNLILADKQPDTQILDKFLFAARAYPTFDKNLLGFVVEGPTSPVFSLDDSSSGHTADNIVENTFEGPWEDDTNNAYNRVVITFMDIEERQGCALVNGDLPAAQTTIPYVQANGVLPFTPGASGTYDPNTNGQLPICAARRFYYQTSGGIPIGAVYIGGELVTFTRNDGYTLTGCSARSKDFADGYPIFWGMQTFPKDRTAEYKDEDNITAVGKEIPLFLDDTAIPNFRQAWLLAKMMVKKFVNGNRFCRLRGKRDTFKLQAGDVVATTAKRPGWVDQPFRIIQAKEPGGEKQEREFQLKFHDSSWYSDDDRTPSAPLRTMLANPFSVPEQVQNLFIAEGGRLAQDGTYLPFFGIVYDFPDDRQFWDHVVIQLKTNSGAYWNYGVDKSGVCEVVGDTGGFKQGDTVYVRLVSVNKLGITSDPAGAPSASSLCLGKLLPPQDVTGYTVNILNDGIKHSWNHNPDVDLWGYEIRLGATGDTGTVLTSGISKNNWFWYPTQAGELHFWIKAIDSSGIYSTNWVEASITITSASVSNLTAQVIDNNVLLKFDGIAGSFPIDDYEVRKGSDYASADVLGKFKGTFIPWVEMCSGTYSYWVTPIDTMGIYGATAGVTALVNEPPNFVLHSSWTDLFTGTSSNIYYDTGTKKFYACADETLLWDAYLTSIGCVTMADYEAQGGYAIEPMTTTASYVQTYDAGAELANCGISVVLNKTNLRGAVNIVCTISVSPDNVTHTDYIGFWQIYATNVRYVKVALALTGTAADLTVFSNLDVLLQTKQLDDSASGTVTVAADGWVFKFNKLFTDIQSVQPSAKGNVAKIAIYDFVDAVSSTVAACTTTLVKLTAGQGSRWKVHDWVKVDLPTGPEVVEITGISTDDLTVSPALSSAPASGEGCYPASVRVYLFNLSGVMVTGDCGCAVKGI